MKETTSRLGCIANPQWSSAGEIIICRFVQSKVQEALQKSRKVYGARVATWPSVSWDRFLCLTSFCLTKTCPAKGSEVLRGVGFVGRVELGVFLVGCNDRCSES